MMETDRFDRGEILSLTREEQEMCLARYNVRQRLIRGEPAKTEKTTRTREQKMADLRQRMDRLRKQTGVVPHG